MSYPWPNKTWPELLIQETKFHINFFECSLLWILCRTVHLWPPAILVFFIEGIQIQLLYLLHLWPPAILDPTHLGLLSFLHLLRQVHQGRFNVPQHTLPPGGSPPLSGHWTVEGIPHLPGMSPIPVQLLSTSFWNHLSNITISGTLKSLKTDLLQADWSTANRKHLFQWPTGNGMQDLRKIFIHIFLQESCMISEQVWTVIVCRNQFYQPHSTLCSRVRTLPEWALFCWQGTNRLWGTVRGWWSSGPVMPGLRRDWERNTRR